MYENLNLERRGDVFILTLQKPPECRITSQFCQRIIRALNSVREDIVADAPDAVIVRGNDAKFFCTEFDLYGRDTNPHVSVEGLYPIARNIVPQGHRFTSIEALGYGVENDIAQPEEVLCRALQLVNKVKFKDKMGVYGLLTEELYGMALGAFQQISYVHSRLDFRQENVKLKR